MNHSKQDHTHPELPKDVHPEIDNIKESEGFRRWWVGGWLSPVIAAGGTILWVLLVYLLIGTRDRHWDYGVLPYIPAKSVLSTQENIKGKVPNQVQYPESENTDESR